jgi:6,7-dimethyl-8-ribityllumazine synthase
MAGPITSVSRKGFKKLSNKKIGIVVSEWNAEITDALFEGAFNSLLAGGIKKRNIRRMTVPGSFELPLAAQWLAEHKSTDAVIALGCVIRGETPHFDYICQAVAHGLMQVNLKSGKPVAFGVLTTLNKKQAEERAGGRLGNKGEEAAVTVLRMLAKKTEGWNK